MQIVRFYFQGWIKNWFQSFPTYHIIDWFQFVEEFLDAFEIYDYNRVCEEFQALLINDDSSPEGFSTRIHHVLCKFNLDDMSFVLNLLSDACAPFIQSYSIVNDESVTNPDTQLQDEFCLQDERNPSENIEQAREVESIENVLTDNQIVFSSEPLHLQSSTIVEGDFIVGLGICPYFSNSFSNQYLDSIIEEHLGDENDLKHSNIPMKQIRDVDLQLEEETLNLHPQIIPYPHERLDVCHESFELSIIQEENLDDRIMLKDLSPKESESIKASEDECLENTIVNYHSSRESFHVLISNSFYSLYPDLFLDSGVHGILPTVSYSFPSQYNLFDMSIFGEINFKHNIYEVGFDALSLSSLAWEKYMSQDDSTQFIFEKDNAFIMEIEDSILHIHSLIRLNSHDSTAHLEPIHLMKRNAQTNNLISIMNPRTMCLSIVDLTHQSDNLDSEFHDRIEYWLHNSYLKNLQSNGKVMLTLFLIENLGGKHDVFFAYPPCEEIREQVENCQENGEFPSWPMVMSGPHNFGKFSESSYILPCFCDLYHDRIAYWLEGSYIKIFRQNGKDILTLFLNEEHKGKGKYDVFIFISEILQSILLIGNFFVFAGLELLQWLHWKFHFT
jgi:hypothetical protein